MSPRTLLTSALLSGAALLPSQASLVGYYPLDGDFQDASGNGNHGTLVGGATYDASFPAALGAGQSVAFDGVAGTYGNIQNAAGTGGLGLTNLPDFSVSMWVKGDGTVNNADDRIFSEGMTTNNNPLFNIGTHSSGANGTVDVFIRNGGVFGHAYSPGTAFDGTWHHVMFTGGEAGLLDLYIDGVFDAQFNY